MNNETRHAIAASNISVIGLVNQKGGVGKSTTTIHLYRWLTLQGFSPIIIDGDSQQSSTAWAQRAGFAVESMANPDDLYKQIISAKHNHDFILIDAPGSLGDPTLAVFEEADLALVPVQANLVDVQATADTIAKLERVRRRRQGKPETLCFISMAREKQVAIADMREAFQQLYPQVPMMESVVYRLDCIPESAKHGCTVWEAEQYASGKRELKTAQKAAEVYEQLFMEAIAWQQTKNSVLV
jgi:chromosome partitioning protein